MTFNWEKCQFMVKTRTVLGYVISKDEIEVDKVKTDLIVNLLPPTCLKEARSFLKHANFH